MSKPVKVKLKKPITGLDGVEVSEIDVQPISVQMYFKNGDLKRGEVRTNGNTETVFITTDMDALRGYISDCTGLPEPLLNMMHPSDVKACKEVVEGFFQDFM